MNLKKNVPWITSTELELVEDTLKRSNLSGFSGTLLPSQIPDLFLPSSLATSAGAAYLGGEGVRDAEHRISDLIGVEYCVLMNSATSALMASIVALGLPKGSMIAVPTVSFSATVAAVIQAGHFPVYVDIDKSTTLSLDSLEKAVTEKEVSAVVFVQWCGNPGNLRAVEKFCESKGILLVEDSSQATLTTLEGGEIWNGTLGICGVFSFNGPKNISAGEGGCVVTDSEEIAAYCRLTRNHGEAALVANDRLDKNRYLVGCNFRPTEITAALVLGQISRRVELHGLRRKNLEVLAEGLKEYLDPVDGLMDTDPYCGGFFLKDRRQRLKDYLLAISAQRNVPIFGNYPLEHWEIGRFFGSSININDYPGTNHYWQYYLGFFSIAYPNRALEMEQLATEICSLLNEAPTDLADQIRPNSFQIGRS